MILIARVFLLTGFIFIYTLAFADGSKDLYPRYPHPVKGNRAFLVSRSVNQNNVFFNQAAHFVYVEEGETLAVASSAQGINNGFIRLISPSGKVIETKGALNGRISSRTAEVAGPGVGYVPFEVDVEVDVGIWRVEFIPTRWSNERNKENPDRDLVVRADAEWQQPDNSYYIAAWDISVRKNIGGWIPGRVYTNVLHLYISSATLNQEEGAFYGQNYVLTKDGYIYKVDGNGSHGIDFQYFVNSSGILDENGAPSYKSSNEGFQASFHNPNKPDDPDNVTHKMFYRFPDVSMPKSSFVAAPLHSTWLYNQVEIAEISNVGFETVEGNKNYVNKKGAFVTFNTNYSGRYKVTIEPTNKDFEFVKKELIVTGNVGFNRVAWDGTDGTGQFIPVGNDYPVKVSISLIEGEIHFPYFDMEINPKGIQVERYNPDGTSAGLATMYWDDTGIPMGAVGESSNPVSKLDDNFYGSNGLHSWGTYKQHTLPNDIASNYRGNDNYGAYSYGNNKAMDTWSYSARMDESIEPLVTVLMADLEVVELGSDKDTVELGETIHYTIEVRNNGPSDVFNAKLEYALPEGFVIKQVAPQSSCGILFNRTVRQNLLEANINLASGCSMLIVVTTKTEATVPDATYGVVRAVTGVIRPEGYYDIDATSDDVSRRQPATAAEECNGVCNNIKVNNEVFLLEPYNERGKLALVKTVQHIDTDGNGFHDEGELLQYTFSIHNTGLVDVSSIYIEDPLLHKQKLMVPSDVLKPGDRIVMTDNYTIGADDLLKGKVENTAMVYGSNPRGFTVKDVSGLDLDNDRPTVIDVDRAPRLLLKGKVINTGTGEGGQFTIGDRIDYEFEIKHEGGIAVGEISIWDENLYPFTNPIYGAYIKNSTFSQFFSYVVNDADIKRGYVEQSSRIQGVDQKYGNLIRDISGHTFEDDLPVITKTAVAPKAVEDNFVIYQGNEGLFNVWENDVLGSSSLAPSKLEILDHPGLAKVSITNGLIKYIPHSNAEFGPDSFTYRLVDNSRLKSEIVRVHIEIKKTVPIAVDDYFSVGYNYEVKINPGKNDYAEYSFIDKGSIRILQEPSHGALSYQDAGIFRYKPIDNYTGYDNFTYSIRDGNGNWSEPASVTLEVTGLMIPNTITPNGDQKNDSFEILGIYQFDKVELEVLDRFGRLIFQSTNYRNDWLVDPNLKEGTYFYTFKGIKSGMKPFIRKGSLLIVRELRSF